MARSAVAAVTRAEITYAPSSLEGVELLVSRLSRERLEDIAETIFCIGCFVGEVMVRNLGGRWVQPEDVGMEPYARFPIVLEMPNGYIWNPIGKTFKRLEMGSAESIPHFYESALSSSGARPE